MAHTVIPPPRGTTATLELTLKGNINDKTISERDSEMRAKNSVLDAQTAHEPSLRLGFLSRTLSYMEW